MADRSFTIKEAATRAGVSADTIRHYERVGVLPRAPRTDNGYRWYTEASLTQIGVVRNAVRLGFSLKELAAFFAARSHGRPPCRSVRAAGQRLLDGMDRQLAELTAARRALVQLLEQWDAALAQTPHGAPAHLLTALGGSPAPPPPERDRYNVRLKSRVAAVIATTENRSRNTRS